MICGLDISTRYIGWTLFEDDGSFVDVGHLDIRYAGNLHDKAIVFKEKFLMERLKYQVNCEKEIHFYVEEPLKAFAKNSSMISTIILLQKMNVLCCHYIYCLFGKEPIMVMESSARKKAGIYVPKGVKGRDKKQFVLDHVKSLGVVPEDKWALKRTGRVKDWCYDQADSFVIATAGLRMNVPT